MKPLALLISLLLCAVVSADETFVRMRFSDTSGTAWATDKVNERLASSLTPGLSAYTLIIAATSCSSAEYKRQNAELDVLGHAVEEMRLLVVIGCPGYGDGYWLHNTEREYILANEQPFRALVLRGDGLVLKDSRTPVSAAHLREALNRAP